LFRAEQDAQRSHDGQAATRRNSAAGQLVNQDGIGADFLRQRDGFRFPPRPGSLPVRPRAAHAEAREPQTSIRTRGNWRSSRASASDNPAAVNISSVIVTGMLEVHTLSGYVWFYAGAAGFARLAKARLQLRNAVDRNAGRGEPGAGYPLPGTAVRAKR
jgi:hypothetical protein